MIYVPYLHIMAVETWSKTVDRRPPIDLNGLQRVLDILVRDDAPRLLSKKDYARLKKIPIKVGLSSNMKALAHVYPFVDENDKIISFRISFNRKYLSTVHRDHIVDTMYHEFAHLLTMVNGTWDESHHHNGAFWDMMKALGAEETPDNTNNVD